MTSSKEPEIPRPARAPKAPRRPMSVSIGPTTLFKAGLARFDPRDPYAFAVGLSWRDFAVLFLAAELVINTAFALLFLAGSGAIANQNPPGFLGAFFFSLETLATVGYGQMYPGTLYGHIVSGIEILTGVIFAAIVTGLLFVRFSRPKPKIVYATNPVVTAYNGRPTFMLRIGNARSSLLMNATVTIHTLVRQTSSEGIESRATVEMRLIRDKNPIFAINWLLMHVIDEQSPLHGCDAGNIEERDLRFFITVTARDQFLGQEITDIFSYGGTDIRFGMRYVDMVTTGEDGRVFADYASLSAITVDTHQGVVSADA